jgi:hypothetical protein
MILPPGAGLAPDADKAGPVLIPIVPDPAKVVMPSGKADPYKFYQEYYKSNDKSRTDPDILRHTVLELNSLRRHTDVHAALLGYLNNHRDRAEPWMYEGLALAIEMIHGSPADVKTSLNYAANLAHKTHNPNHLVSTADKLYVRGYFERVGALLDAAIEQIPHRFEPFVLSINLAQKTSDPVRMADAVDGLLSIGWPGWDDYFRIEAANQVDTLAKKLRSHGKEKEAAALEAKLTASQARDLVVRLTWDGNADFDLVVDEPLGATATYQTPRTVFGGSMIKNGYGSHPDEIYVCPRAFDGDYTIRVTSIWTDPDKPVSTLTLETVTHDGTPQETKETHSLLPDKPNKPVVVHLSGGRRKKVLPYVDPLAAILSSAGPPKNKTQTPSAEKNPAGRPGAAAARERTQSPK